MAKSQKNGTQHGNGGQSKQGGSIKGSDCAKNSAANREATRKEEARLAQVRHALKQTGQFFINQNDGRETDIFKLEAGQTGEYAIPGGDKPSVHVHVTEIGTPEKPFRVVYFDQAHEGSGLPGNLSKETFLPVWTLSKDSFTSRMDGHRAETQNQLFSFLTATIDNTRVQVAKDKDANELATMFNKSDKDLRGIKHGQLGHYAVTKGDDVVVFSVFMAKCVSVSVLRSTIPDLQASKAFLPVKLFDYPELRQVTTDEIYKGQLAIFSFLKPLLDGLVENEPMKVSRPILHAVMNEPKPAAPLVTPAKQEVVGTMSVTNIMKGKIGVVVFTSGEQSLTVNVHDKTTLKGPIRFFEVTAKSDFDESPVLPIEVGTFVTAEQLIAQTINKADMAGLPPKSISTKLALIAFIMKAVKGTRFCRKPSEAILPKQGNLQLVA